MILKFKSFPSLLRGPSQAIRLALVLAVCLLVFIQGVTVNAQGAPAMNGAVRKPLGELLTPEGRLELKAGYSGALDPTGWRIKRDLDGEPQFEPMATQLGSSTGTWQALGSGLNGYVLAIAVEGPNVYVGGIFTDAGGNPNADYIARWDGTAWHPLGSGLNDYVGPITVEGPNVYVGGIFTDAGGNSNADRIARWSWDQSNMGWQALGSGLNDYVSGIAVQGSNVYVGGGVMNAGGNPNLNWIARWGPVYRIYLPLILKN